LKSIYKYTKNIDFEIIVVDNASTDGSQQLIKKTFPHIKLIENKENIGFGRANNLGATESNGKYLFFLNSDTILINNAINYFFVFAESYQNTKLAIYGTLLLDKELKPTHSSGSFPSKLNILKVILFGYFDRSYFLSNHKKEKLIFNNEPFFKVDYITGADLFILKQLFNQVNGFNPSYFMYYEDTDLQKRMQQFEVDRLIISGPRIIHLEGGSNKEPLFSKQKRIMVTKSMFLYFRLFSNPLSYFVFRIFFLVIRLPIIFDNRLPFKDRIKFISFLLTN